MMPSTSDVTARGPLDGAPFSPRLHRHAHDIRSLFRLCVWALVVGAMGLAAAVTRVDGQDQGNPATSDPVEQNEGVFDHHVHLLSPRLIQHWKSLGMAFSREDALYCDAAAIASSQNIAGGCLISMAHLYASDDFAAIDGDDEQRAQWLSDENDFICAAASQGDQWFGFVSVSPLSESAIAELERCRKLPGFAGIKLHLPACGVDLANEDHVVALNRVVAFAGEHDLPVLIHLFYFGLDNHAQQSRIFWDRVALPNSGTNIILAHLGAAGGFNAISESLLEGWLTLADAHPEFERRRVQFDLSGAILVEETDGLDSTSEAACARLGRMMRTVGISQFLFASDYPVFSVDVTRTALRERLGLSENEWQSLLANRPTALESACCADSELRSELLQRMQRDQEARQAMVASSNADGDDAGTGFVPTPEAIAAVMQIDAENLEWLKAQVDTDGWPGRSRVGGEGARAAWLLVQHCDKDPDFQERCLKLMVEAGAAEVDLKNVAYLTDRVLTARDKPQRYGTQIGMSNGKFEVKPCEDPDNLDQRRATVGLEPIAEYLEKVRRAYSSR